MSATDIPLYPDADEAVLPQPARRWRLTTFSALRHRNYRLYFLGQMVSLVGSWVQTTALMSLAYKLGDKQPSWPATIAAAQLLPTLLLGAWAGTLVDRWPKRGLIFTTQSLQLVIALLLSAYVLFGRPEVWHLLLFALAAGVVNALDLPARMAFVIDLVGRDDLVNAVALNSMLFNTARAVGPFLGALLFTVLNAAHDPKEGLSNEAAGYCFLINGLSFLAVLAALAWMDVARTAHIGEHTTLRGMVEAARYLFDHRGLFYLLVLSGSLALLGWPVLSLLPAVADKQLHTGEDGYCYLLSGVGCGALVGAFFVATFATQPRRYLFFGCGTLLTAASLLCLAFVSSLPLAVLCCVVFGLGPSLFFSTAQSTVQLTVTDANRGRVLGIWSMVTTGTLPVGNLLAGKAADYLGVWQVTACLGVGIVGATALVLLCARLTR